MARCVITSVYGWMRMVEWLVGSGWWWRPVPGKVVPISASLWLFPHPRAVSGRYYLPLRHVSVTLYPSDCIPPHSLRAGIGASILEPRNKPPTSGSRDKSR